jgi:hypothetical protein
VWEDRFNRPCPHCRLRIGIDCQLLMSAGKCPSCHVGNISPENPVCSACYVDFTELIEWPL